MDFKSKRVDFIKGQEFWCNECDQKIVNSEDPTTGHFYMIFGHIYQPSSRAKDYGMPTSIKESVSVVFALCPDCEN